MLYLSDEARHINELVAILKKNMDRYETTIEHLYHNTIK